MNKKPYHLFAFIDLKQNLTVRYPSNLWLGLLAFVAAQLIILFEEEHSLLEILRNPYYYIALALSMGIAWLLMYYVRLASGLLDEVYPWHSNYRLRWPRQLIFGLLVPCTLAVLLAAIYFAAFGISIWDTVYLSRYFQQILLLLLVFNALLFYCWFITHQAKNEVTDEPKTMVANEPLITLEPIVAYVYTRNRHCFALDFEGKDVVWKYTLSKSKERLDPEVYFLVNRCCLVHRNAIAEVQVIHAKKTSLVLVAPIGISINVSQRNNVCFKKWYFQT